MGSMKWLIPMLFTAGCVSPADTLYIEQEMESSRGVNRKRSKVIYATNLSKSTRDVERVAVGYLGKFDGMDSAFEFIRYEDDGRVRKFSAALRGNPEPLYMLLNLVHNAGDYHAWIQARSQNDGLLGDVLSFKGIRNKKTGYVMDTDIFKLFQRPDGLYTMGLTNEKDKEKFDAASVAHKIMLQKYLEGLPGDFEKYMAELKRKHESGEKVEADVAKLGETFKRNSEAFITDVLVTPGYGYHPKMDEIKTKLKELVMKGKVVNYETWMAVEDKYHPAVVFTKAPLGSEFVVIQNDDVENFLEEPVATINNKPKLKGKIGKK